MAKPEYDGYGIQIYEWPAGCEIKYKELEQYVLIQSPEDAKAVVESLTRYLSLFEEKHDG